MKHLIITIFLLVSGIAQAQAVHKGGPGTYVAFNDRYDNSGHMYATLWKNGAAQRLSKAWDSRVSSVFAIQNDVYAAGSVTEKKDDKSVATLWKNGVAQKLGGENSSAYSVFVEGNNVYVAGGQIRTSGNAAKLWINGKEQTLSYEAGFNLFAYSVFVTGKDVYVAGTARNAESGESRALLWVNGKAQNIGEGYVRGLHVSGGDVYVVGETSGDNAWLRKNGEEQALEGNNFKSRASAVYVSGSDVYVVGRRSKNEADTTPKIATLWKNGVAQDLTDGQNLSAAASVFVSGGDVYVTGFDNVTNVLWKNGQRQNLPGRAGGGMSVFVAK